MGVFLVSACHFSIFGRNLGTVGAVALDRNGNVAYATSTGGIMNKMVGRVGDTPCIGGPPDGSAPSHPQSPTWLWGGIGEGDGEAPVVPREPPRASSL